MSQDPHTTETAAPAWLFTRGAESVRITTHVAPDGVCCLVVEGPGPAGAAYELPDVMACLSHQQQIERRLVAEGFHLEAFTIERRRAAHDRRIHTRRDRRRAR